MCKYGDTWICVHLHGTPKLLLLKYCDTLPPLLAKAYVVLVTQASYGVYNQWRCCCHVTHSLATVPIFACPLFDGEPNAKCLALFYNMAPNGYIVLSANL
jgi:hypothetical protein